MKQYRFFLELSSGRTIFALSLDISRHLDISVTERYLNIYVSLNCKDQYTVIINRLMITSRTNTCLQTRTTRVFPIWYRIQVNSSNQLNSTNASQTRMHSSRMCTARSLPYGGLPDRDPPGDRPVTVNRITDGCKNTTFPWAVKMESTICVQ